MMTTNYDKESLKQHLKEGVHTVVFQKKDGTERTMKCTLDPNRLVPQTEKIAVSKVRVENPDVLAVWDIDKQSWRSFRIDSIVTFD